jgi:signal transduction histidine kinase
VTNEFDRGPGADPGLSRAQSRGPRQRADALLSGEKQLLEMVASGRPLTAVLDALCRLLDATADGCSSGVLLLDRTRTRVQQAVTPGLPAGYLESLVGGMATTDAGPCGMAVTLKTQVIVSDVASDTRWEHQGWPALALAHGLNACWSSPILSSGGEALGTLAIYQRSGNSPTPFHQGVIQKLTHIASIAIERTRREDALKRSETFLAEAQRLSSTGSFSWCVATGDITWSEQVYRIFEVDPSVPATLELVGARVHPEDAALLHDMIERAHNGTDFESEHRLQMPDGSVKHLHLVAHATLDESGRPEYIGAIQDVTERRLSEETLGKVRSELAHVARVLSLGALTASIAHEVNQPLSGIITNASTCLRMLAADPPNLDGARETARRTIRDGNRAADVITRLRALFGRKEVTTESVDLNEATREVIALSLSELQGSRAIVRPELADDLPPVTGDRVQLQQVILNLLRNAADAMRGVDDRPRLMVIRTESDQDDSVRLTVKDTGAGFEPEAADKLFDAFYTTKSGGMGIGLSVSRSIIERHHGRLWAAPNDGPGATFTFSIPRRAADAVEPS